MMNPWVIVASILGTIVILVSFIILGVLYWDFRRLISSLISALQDTHLKLSAVQSIPAEEIHEALQAQPKLMEGLAKVCEALVAEQIEQRKITEKFHESLFGTEPTDAIDRKRKERAAYTPYDEESAQKEWEKKEAELAGRFTLGT